MGYKMIQGWPSLLWNHLIQYKTIQFNWILMNEWTFFILVSCHFVAHPPWHHIPMWFFHFMTHEERKTKWTISELLCTLHLTLPLLRSGGQPLCSVWETRSIISAWLRALIGINLEYKVLICWEVEYPEKTPRRHRENTQTLHRKELKPMPCCCKATVVTTPLWCHS